MKYDDLYRRAQSAARVEVVLLLGAVLTAGAAVLMLLRQEFLTALHLLVLALLQWGLGKAVDLLADNLGCVGRLEEWSRPDRPLPGNAYGGEGPVSAMVARDSATPKGGASTIG